jgi:acrylyl-CoA reductase (NADPH)
VVAATGKMQDKGFLTALGAAEVISRDELAAGTDKPLQAERWAGGIDVVGGPLLSAVLKGTRYGGTVTCCGLVGSPELPVNVYPFILRGVSLIGIDSVLCPRDLRKEVWQRLATCWKPTGLDAVVTESTLDGLEGHIQTMLSGGMRGRVLLNLLEG